MKSEFLKTGAPLASKFCQPRPAMPRTDLSRAVDAELIAHLGDDIKRCIAADVVDGKSPKQLADVARSKGLGEMMALAVEAYAEFLAGKAWWNTLPERERRAALEAAGEEASVADAYRIYRRKESTGR